VRDDQRVATDLTPAFRHCLVIEGNQLADEDFDMKVAVVLKATFAEFIIQLPHAQTAMNELQVAHIATNGVAHATHTRLLLEIRNIVHQFQQAQAQLPSEDPYLDATTIQHESSRPEFKNPFRIVTAENFDHDYDSLARLFEEPIEFDKIKGHDNLIIAGGRGCGKSMILKSLSLAPALEIKRLRRSSSTGNTPRRMTYEESGLDYFGVYLKLFRGYFSTYTPDCKLRDPQC
jgi:hypothetical protein